MLVNQEIIDELCKSAGTKKREKAIRYKNQKKITLTKVIYDNESNFELKAKVKGNYDDYETYIAVKNGELEDISCTCPDYHNYFGVCKHSLATVLYFADSKSINLTNQENKQSMLKASNKNKKYNNFTQIINTIYNEELEQIDSNVDDTEIKDKGTIKIQPSLIYDKFNKRMKIEFKIGNKRMYKLKNLSEFYKNMMNKDLVRYGDKLKFVHTKEMFEEESQELLEFIIKYSEIIYYTNSNANSSYQYYGKALSESYIVLSNTGLDEIFEILNGKNVEFKNEYSNLIINFSEQKPNLDFSLEKINDDEYRISADFDIYEVTIFRGNKYKYILQDNKLYRCSKEFEQTNLKLLNLFKEHYLSEITFGKDELGDLFSILLPKVKEAIKIDDNIYDEIKKYKPEKFHVKVFLDFDKNDYLIADVRFCYGENEFNPLNQKEEKDFKSTRNMIEETQALNLFRKTGFMFDTQNLRFILPDNDRIYEFLTNDISVYMKKFEVLVTENFKTKEITKPKIGNLGVRLENNLLAIDLSNINIDSDELQEVMEKYKLKKKYYRLKDGSFLDLQDNEDIAFLDELVTGMDIDYKELENGSIKLPVNRTLYLNELLKKLKGTEVNKDREYKEIVNVLDKDSIDSDIEIPKNIDVKLRAYQKIGFKWLKTLDLYKFGGILADDMGLGKTIQIITLLESIKENEENRTSIVVSPSSLAFNWKNEIEKFAPNLKVCVIRGNSVERKKQINQLEKQVDQQNKTKSDKSTSTKKEIQQEESSSSENEESTSSDNTTNSDESDSSQNTTDDSSSNENTNSDSTTETE